MYAQCYSEPDRFSEGEVLVYSGGGVGVFGEVGAPEAALREKKWTRVVVTVGPAPPPASPSARGTAAATGAQAGVSNVIRSAAYGQRGVPGGVLGRGTRGRGMGMGMGMDEEDEEEYGEASFQRALRQTAR